MAIAQLTRSLIAGTLALAIAVPAAGAAEVDRQQIETIVRDYLIENPEVIQEALIALERKRRDQESAARAETIERQSAALFESEYQAELGNPRGDVTLVEFFDYNCSFCKRALADMVTLLEQDENLRVVMKEFPVLGEGSVEAAQVSIAVERLAPEKYLDFHALMFARPGQADKASAMEVVEQIGLDPAEVEKLMRDGEVNAAIEEVYALANGLGLTGTPSYVVGNQVLMGAVGYEELRDKIKATRECTATATC